MNSSKRHEDDEHECGLIGVNIGNYYLPQDLMEDHILIILPAKSLLRFRALNKSWNSVITSTRFRLKHYDRKLKLRRHHGQHHLLISSAAEICKLDPFNNLHLLLRPSPTYSMEHLSAGLIAPHRLIAVSNGIVLIYRDSLWLWNPATGVSVILPPRGLHGDGGMRLLGFWFDPKSQEYMVIDGKLWDPGYGWFKLYSSRTGCWKSCRAKTCLVPKTRNRGNSMDEVYGWSECTHRWDCATRACIDGKCYWLANEKQSHRSEVPVVIIYDFEAEEEEDNCCNFDVMTFPETNNQCLSHKDGTVNLIEYEGCLTLLTTYFVANTTKICDVWVMCGEKDDHYGIMWEHKFSIHFDVKFFGLGRRIEEPRALKRMSNGELALVFKVSVTNGLYLSNVKLILYNPSTETYEDIEIAPFDREIPFEVVPYVESLFYLAPMKAELVNSGTTTCSKEDEQRRTQVEGDDRRRKRGPKHPFVLKNISGNLKKLFSRCI